MPGQVYGALERADDPLLPTSSKVIEDKPSLVKRVAGTALAVALLAGVGLAAVYSNTTAQPKLSSEIKTTVLNVGALDEMHRWFAYKLAFIAPAVMREEVFHFLNKYVGGTYAETVSLGCDGYKLNVQLGDTARQFHYVTAPDLPSDADGMDANAWIKLQMDDLGDMSEFSPFVHDKATVYVHDIAGKLADLKDGNYDVMMRQSYATDGVLMGHVLVPIAGKVWEFIGSLHGMSAAKAASKGWSKWEEEECPMAHAIHASSVDLSSYANSSNTSVWTALSNAVDSVDSANFYEMMNQMVTLTDPSVVSSKTDYCSMVTMTWDAAIDDDTASSGVNVEMRYVENFNYKTMKSGETVKDFQEYVYDVHEKYLKPYDQTTEERWRNWDHWLDFHIGLMYRESDDCATVAKAVTNTLLQGDVPCGKRMVTSDGDHYYTGYAGGSITVEYNTECHFGTGTSNICACAGMNSYFLADAENITDATCDLVHEMDVEEKEDGDSG